jgi:hypothetical protein
MNDDLPTVTIFSASYSLCYKVSFPRVPSQYFFSIKRVGKGTVIPVHVMKAYAREEVKLHTLSSSALDGVISFITCLLNRWYSLNRRQGGPQRLLGCFGEEISLSSARN